MRFRLLTYNIHKGIGVDRKFLPERIVEILKHYEPDIALLQEVDDGVPRSGLLNLSVYLARRLGYPHQALGLNVFLRRSRYGNATLSRHPIGRQRNIDLTIRGTKGRGAQHTRILVGTAGRRRAVDVFNIHLSLLARMRHVQITRLLATDDVRGLDEQRPCIIAGDMNDWRGLLRERLFLPAGFTCATNLSGRRSAIRTFPSFAPTGALDKIFYRGRLRLLHVAASRLRLTRVASDHLPVVSDWELV